MKKRFFVFLRHFLNGLYWGYPWCCSFAFAWDCCRGLEPPKERNRDFGEKTCDPDSGGYVRCPRCIKSDRREYEHISFVTYMLVTDCHRLQHDCRVTMRMITPAEERPKFGYHYACAHDEREPELVAFLERNWISKGGEAMR